MAHFAHISDGKVTRHESTGIAVIVIANSDCGGGEFPDSESHGQAFLASLGIDGVWKQTSYNHNFRKQFAGEGYAFDSDADVFITPSPYPSWVLDENHDWEPPISMPSVGGPYYWDEPTVSWQPVPKDTEIGDTTFEEL